MRWRGRDREGLTLSFLLLAEVEWAGSSLTGESASLSLGRKRAEVRVGGGMEAGLDGRGEMRGEVREGEREERGGGDKGMDSGGGSVRGTLGRGDGLSLTGTSSEGAFG